jgi:hypothetical protein
MKSEVCGMENLDDRNHSDERERRSKRRFPISREVKYKMLYSKLIAETGTGRTLNLSSAGIWFSTENHASDRRAGGTVARLAGTAQ